MIKFDLLKKPVINLIFPGIIGLFILGISNTGLLEPVFDDFEHAFKDLRSIYRAEALERTFDPVVIVDVDSRSLYKLGKMRGWPREYFAEMVEYVSEGGAEAVVFDIIFDRGIEAQGDSIFAKVVANSGNVFFALSFTEADSENFLYKMEKEPEGFDFERFYYSAAVSPGKIWSKPRIDNDFFDLINPSAGTGFVNSVPDRDGVIRSAELLLDFNGHYYPSLAFSVLMKLMGIEKDGVTIDGEGSLFLKSDNGEEFTIPLNSAGRLGIDYLGSFQTFRYISFYDVLKERVPADYFAGKVVFVGSSAPGMADLKSVPVQRKYPGVEIHATILADILNGWFISNLGAGYNLIVFFTICIAAFLIGLKMKTWQSIPLSFLVSMAYLIAGFQIFAVKGIFIEMIRPGAGYFFSFLSAIMYKYIVVERDRRFISSAFSHFVDKEVIKEITANPSKLKLGGERREITVVFSDIRDFTSISELMKPEKLAEFLNVHLTAMTDIVFKYGGLLDKYIGDAVVAIFGAPVQRENHAEMAAEAAIEMIRKVAEIRSHFTGTPMENLTIGIGINTGTVSVGNMGSDYRFEYTAIGDEMNLGSRLEGLNKVYGTKVIISQNTARQLSAGFRLRELDFVQVKGKREPVGIYELIDPAIALKEDFIGAYQRGLTAYCAGQWEDAETGFREVLACEPADNPSRIMLDRIKVLKENPPGDDWIGVWKYESK